MANTLTKGRYAFCVLLALRVYLRERNGVFATGRGSNKKVQEAVALARTEATPSTHKHDALLTALEGLPKRTAAWSDYHNEHIRPILDSGVLATLEKEAYASD